MSVLVYFTQGSKTIYIYSMSAMNTAASPILVTDSDIEPTPSKGITPPIQATSDDESVKVMVAPEKDFFVANEVYVQPVQETSPSGNDQLVP